MSAVFFAACPAQAQNPAASAKTHSRFEAFAPVAAAADGKLKAHVDAFAPIICAKAWLVFTDFEAMPKFLPGVELSKVRSVVGNKVFLEQKGFFRYGIFSKTYTSTRELTMVEFSKIDSISLATDEVPIISTTTFNQVDGMCSIRYSTTIGIPDWAPSFAAVGFAKSMAHAQMNAMVAELKKRFGPALPVPIEQNDPNAPTQPIERMEKPVEADPAASAPAQS